MSTTNRSNYGSALGYIPELPWNDSTITNALLSANTPAVDSNGDTNIVAGGGGASGCVNPDLDSEGNLLGCNPSYSGSAITGWAKPSWQMGGNLNIPADEVRDLPDVSLLAGDGTRDAAWLVCSSIDFSGNPVTDCVPSGGSFEAELVGGTSAATPAFAGILALVSQSQNGARLGQANYVLYNLASHSSLYGSIFHDITAGNNSAYCEAGTPDCGGNLFEMGYNTGAEYDQASGLGSVDATQLVNDWNKATFTSSTTAFTINGGTVPVSITHGDTVTLSATVTGAGGTPTGSVAIVGNANQEANTYGANGIAVLALSNGTTGATSFSDLPGGAYTVSANYGGDITFAQSQSSPAIQVTVAKENSILELTAETFTGNVTPSASYPYGTYITLDAQPVGQSQVNAQTPASATGSVIFSDSSGLPSGVSGTVAINSFGYAELPLYYWSVASHAVSASYGGDNSFNSSSAAAIPFNIAKAPTASTVISSVSSVSGGTFTVTSVITPTPASGATPPSGTVALTANGITIGTGAVTGTASSTTGAALGTVAITVYAISLMSGANTITATYSGDANYSASSGTVVVTWTAVPSLAISGSSIAPITAGSSGDSVISLVPNGGFTGVVNLTCSVNPSAGASVPTCAYDPTSVTIPAGLPAISSLTVTTTSTTTTGAYTVAINAADAATGRITATGTLPFTVNEPRWRSWNKWFDFKTKKHPCTRCKRKIIWIGFMVG